MIAYFKSKEAKLEIKTDIHILVGQFLFSIGSIDEKDSAELRNKIENTMVDWAKEKGYDK